MNERPRNEKLRRRLVGCVSLCVFLFVLFSSQQAGAAVLYPGNINACGELAAPGTYSLTSDVATTSGAACFTITSNGVTLTSSTTGSYTVNGDIVGDANASSSPGFNFSIEDLTVTGTTSSNGGSFGTTTDFTDTGSAGNAGSITISTSTMGAIVANGGIDYNDNYGNYSGVGGTIMVNDSTFASISANGGGDFNDEFTSGMTGGNGGTIAITGTSLNLSGDSISASGGTGGILLGVNGSDGALTLNYTTLNHAGLTLSSLSSLVLNGPGSVPGNLGDFGAGIFGAIPGDTITAAAQCNLGLSGTYILGSDISGNCNITQNSIVLNGSDHTINGNVIGDGVDDISGYYYPGHTFVIENAVVTGTTSANGATAPMASVGGSITVVNSTTTGISANGGSNPIVNGGNGGSVTIMASSTNLSSTSLSLAGGVGGTYGGPGSPGDLTIDYVTLEPSGYYFPAVSDLILNGPGNSPGNLGAFAGGVLGTLPGGTIMNASQCVLNFVGTYTLGADLTGNCDINISGVVINGAGHTINGNIVGDNASGNGYDFTLENATVTGTVSSDAIGTTTVGTGGVISIATSTVYTVTANGSVNSVSSGSSVNGGSVAATSSTITSIQVNGGSDTGGSLGYGGSVFLNDSTSTSIQANGSAGGGGSITLAGGGLNLSNMGISATGGGGSPALGTLTLDYSTIIFSNLTLSALSDLKLNGPSDTPGDLGAFAGGTVSTVSPGGTISDISQCFLVSPGTYNLGSDLTGNCVVRSNNIILNGAGHALAGNIDGDGTIGSGYDFTVENITVTGTTSADAAGIGDSGGSVTVADSNIAVLQSNGSYGSSIINGGTGGTIIVATSTVGIVQSNGGDSGDNGGGGGSVTLVDSTTTSISSNGGGGVTAAFSGSGGAITLTGTNLNLTGVSISAAEGSSQNPQYSAPGTLTLNYTTLNFASTTYISALSDLVLDGPGNLPGNLGAYAGGSLPYAVPGSTITNISSCDFIAPGTYYLGSNLTGNCRVYASGVIINGAGHTLNGSIDADSNSSGYSFDLENIAVTGTTSSNGTAAYTSGSNGGDIVISSSTLATTTSNGGNNGGDISFTDSTATFAQANGGPMTFNGSNGGDITAVDSVLGSIQADGTFGASSGGNGGSIIITADSIDLSSTTIVSVAGGGSSFPSTYGKDGILTLNYSTLNTAGAVLPSLSDLVLNGPGGLPGDLGAFSGGPLILSGSTITDASQCSFVMNGTYTLGNDIIGDCHIKADGVTLDGAGHKITGNVIGDGATNKRGYDFTLENVTVTATSSSNGNGSIGGYGMPGGDIMLMNATSTGITANGGALGGSITLTNSSINLASTTFSATGSVKNGTLTLNYTTLNASGSSLPALSDLVLNGPGDLPGDLGAYAGPIYGGDHSFSLGGGTISDAAQCSFIGSSGLYTLTSDISGANCNIYTDGVVIDGDGHTMTGSVVVTGHDFVLRNVTVAGGLQSGDIVTIDNTGGTIDLSQISSWSNFSSNGQLTLDYTNLSGYSTASLPALSDLVLNGPGDSPGDVGAFSGGPITAPGGTVTNASQCFLVFPGVYTVGNSFTGNCGIHADGVTLSGASTTIDGNVSGNGVFPGGSGYDFTLQNITASGTVSSNGAVNTNGVGGNGGSITIDDASSTIDLATTTVSATGGVGSSGNGAAGTLVLDYSTLNYAVSLPAFSDLVLNGPGDIPGDVGAFGGGFIATLPGGVITNSTELSYLNLPGTYTLGNDITGNAGIYGNGIVIDGAGHTLNGSVIGDGSDEISPSDWGFFGSGSSFTLENITVTGTTSANGGNFYPDNDYQPGSGGSITISNSTVATTTANGGYATEYHDAANGGTITINDSTTTFVQADGGAGSYFGGSYRSGAGGNGGTITIDPSVTGAVEADGGASPVKPAGNGGNISITNSTANPVGSTVTANGGDSTVCGYGGNGGTISLVNSTYGAASADPGQDQLSGGCNQYNNQSISSSGSSYGGLSSSGLGGLVQIVGQYVPAISSLVSPSIPQSPAIPAPIAVPTAGESAFGGSSGSVVSVPGIVSIQSTSSIPAPVQAFISSISSAAAKTVAVVTQKVAQTAVAVSNSPAAQTVQATGFFAGLVASAISIADTAYATPLAAEALLTPLRLWGLALMGLGIRKRGRPWGTVYDSVTKQPIDPAYVTVRDTDGKVVAESITDIDGRYGFLLPDGTYYLSVKKTNYEFPSKKMDGKTFDELYGDLYFGGPITVSAGQVIDRNIPMDQKDFDWNEAAKRERNALSFHPRNEKGWTILSDLIYGIGFIISVIVVMVHRSPYNIIMLALYVSIIIFLNIGFKNKRLGHVVDGATREPMSYAIVRVTAFDHETVLRSAVCDARGRYYCIVPKGQYYVDIDKKNPDGSYSKAYVSDIISNNSGVLNTNFTI